jgi:retron-type reverse transcriptase
MEILGERIKDNRFLDLIRKALKAGYMEFGRYQHSIVGTPQGSIISPILSNIYLDRLDQFMAELKTEFDRGTKPTINTEYKRLSNRKFRSKTIDEKKAVQKLMTNVGSKMEADPNFKKIEYVRYADD